MATLLERVAKASKQRALAELEFRAALVAARPTYSWAQLASATGLTKNGVKYLVEQHRTKGENGGRSDEATDSERDGGDAGAHRRRRRPESGPQAQA